MKKLIILFILLSCILLAKEGNNQKSEFGIAVGVGMSYGLSFKTNLSENFAVRITGGAIMEDHSIKGEEKGLAYNLGLGLNYSLIKNNQLNFYLSTAIVHTYETRKSNPYSHDSEYFKEHDTRGTLGLGLSFYLFNKISISLEVNQVFENSLNLSKDSRDFNTFTFFGSSVGILF